MARQRVDVEERQRIRDIAFLSPCRLLGDVFLCFTLDLGMSPLLRFLSLGS